MPEKRPSINEAQKSVKKFLETKLTDHIPAEKLQELMPLLGEESTADSFFEDDSDETARQSTNLTLENITMRDMLDFMPQQLFADPFILSSTRDKAKKEHPREYAELIELLDWERGKKLGIPLPITSYFALIQSLKDLADQGKRPAPIPLRAGIKTLQKLIQSYKENHVNELPQNQTSVDFEEFYYSPRLLITLMILLNEKVCGISDKLFQSILAASEITDQQLKEDMMLDLEKEVRKQREASHPMKGIDYERQWNQAGEVASSLSLAADMLKLILVQSLQVAKDLDILTNQNSRGA